MGREAVTGAIALATIAPKLAKILPLLASDKDGEVIATARAIGRMLAGAQADWHDLVRVLTEPPAENYPDHGADLPFVLRCLHRHPSLDAWESDFIASIARLQARKRSLSDKQRAAVLRIWERLQ
jgi:hypothetical protein